MSSADYYVQATKKGGAPLTVEKRKYGKAVTILPLSSVKGDANLLLTQLKNALGTGGANVDGHLELQGDRFEAAATWLRNAGVLRCAKKLPPPEQEAKPPPQPRRQPEAAQPPLAKPPLATPLKPAKHGSSPYGRFISLMRSWQYWDHDYSSLPQRWEERRQQGESGVDAGGELEGGSAPGLEEALLKAVEGALASGEHVFLNGNEREKGKQESKKREDGVDKNRS